MHNGSASSWREEPLLIGCARHVRIQNHPRKPWFRQAKDFLNHGFLSYPHDLLSHTWSSSHFLFVFMLCFCEKVCKELTWKRLLANKYASTECINDFIIYSLFSYIIILAMHYTICTSQVIHERDRAGI